MTVQFQEKFNQLPKALQKEVLQFMDLLLSKIKKSEGKKQDEPFENKPEIEFSSAGDLKNSNGKESMRYLANGNKMLPITPATEKTDIAELAGIWKNEDITIEKLRQKAWGNRQ